MAKRLPQDVTGATVAFCCIGNVLSLSADAPGVGGLNGHGPNSRTRRPFARCSSACVPSLRIAGDIAREAVAPWV
jgi:hypothetical protein